MTHQHKRLDHSTTSLTGSQNEVELGPLAKGPFVRVLEMDNSGRSSLSDNYVRIGDVTANSETSHVRLIACNHPTIDNYNAYLSTLFRVFDTPLELVAEEQHSAGHSFGVRDRQGYHDTWFRYLQKNLHVARHENGDVTVASRTDNGEDYTWLKGGFYVRWHREKKTVDVILAVGVESQIIQRVFAGVTEYLRGRRANFDLIVKDAYQIYVLLWSQFFTIEDSIVWSIIAVIRTTERAVYSHAERQLQKGTELSYHLDYDFVHLHNLAKHLNYLHETAETKMCSLKCIIESHEDYWANEKGPGHVGTLVKRNLKYHEELMRGLALRLGTMERRVTNIVNLAFQLVTQLETRSTQKDSASLKTVSYLTLIFLPGTAVASIFGSNFFNFDVDESGKQTFSVSNSFWIFWVLVVAVTFVTLVVWRINNWFNMRELRERVSNPQRRRPLEGGVADVAGAGFTLHRPGGNALIGID